MFASARRASRALRLLPVALAAAAAPLTCSAAEASSVDGTRQLPSRESMAPSRGAYEQNSRPAAVLQCEPCSTRILAASAADEDDLAASSDLDTEVQITDDDIPGRKKAAFRFPSASRLAAGAVGVARLPWDIVTGEINDPSEPSKRTSSDSDDDPALHSDAEDTVLSFDDLLTATGIAPVVRSKPIELILMRSIKKGAGEDLVGERPIGDAYDAVAGALSALVPSWLKERLWGLHTAPGEGEDDDLLMQTDTSGSMAAAKAAAEAAATPGEDGDDEDLGMGDESNNAMLVQVNAGLTTASRSAEAPHDGLDLMVVPLLVLGRWNLATNMQRLQGQAIPIVIPNARRTGGKHDVSLQAVIFPDTGNMMMPKGLVSSVLGCKLRGPDYTFEYNASLDTRQPDEHKLTYFQTIVPAVAVGGSVAASGGKFLNDLPDQVRFGAMAAYTPDGGTTSWLARYDPSDADAIVRLRHFREVNERAKLMTEVTVKEDMSSQALAAIELPLRQEPFMREPYTLLKASVSSSGVLKATVEHSIAQGSDCMGRLEVGASVDAFTDTNCVSLGYMLQA